MLASLAASLAVGVLSSQLAEGARGDRCPNLLLFLADNLGVEGLGCSDRSAYRTPNPDRLAQEALRSTGRV